jgi:hypothetical protein
MRTGSIIMTTKNAKKNAARALQAKSGGKYQARLRQVGGGGTEMTHVQIVPKFDPTDPRNKTKRLGTGAYQDPMRPVEIVNGSRRILFWVFPHPEGRAGWRFEVRHVKGPWPIDPTERAALEDWLEGFATTEWSDRIQLWPIVYMPELPNDTNYYAVLVLKNGTLTLAPRRDEHGVSQVLFAFLGPAFATDEELDTYFRERFLPLKIVYQENGKWLLSHSSAGFGEAVGFAKLLMKSRADVRVLTQEDNEVWRSTGAS